VTTEVQPLEQLSTSTNSASRPAFLTRIHTFLRSAGVGALSTLADLGALFILVQWARLKPALANVPALLAGVSIQFLGNKLFAFGNQSRGRALLRQGGQFALIETGALALNALSFQLLVAQAGLPYLLARVLSSAAVYLGYSFPLWNRLFQPERAQ